ncbi:MAG: fasciclin domain-containing protein, partial [Anaerolineae bacterium]|nr:fasciclin domain-containing protein [Anaerolineae bacterium]
MRQAKSVFAALFVLAVLVAAPVFAQDETPTIAEIVVSSAEADAPEFTVLLAAVQAADPAILEALSDPEAELTVFTPTDAAFAALAEALGEEAFNEILTEEGTPRLNEILLYHAVNGVVMSGDVVAGLEEAADMEMEGDDMMEPALHVVTLSGQYFDIAGNVEDGITVGNANLVLDMVDIEASNGVIHVIDAVLVPELRTIADIVVELASAEEGAEFTTLLTAVQAADPAVLELLADPTAAVTVFAPTDAAFGAVEGLEDIVADTALLTTILQYHVFPGTVYSFELPGLLDDMGSATITMADGSDATITVDDMGATINEANIIDTDIQASNGVIHV